MARQRTTARPAVTPATPGTVSSAAPPAIGAATINDIARLAGVSKKTVSRVINNSPFVREDTRSRITATMQEYGYTPDPQARGLAFRKSFLIGLVYDNPNAQYIVNIQDGALDALRGSGFELVVHPCDRRSSDYLPGVRRFVRQQKLGGVILLPPVSEDAALSVLLDELDCRHAQIASVLIDPAALMVVSNDREASAEVANYLESLGHRRIALICGPASYRSARERREGFLGALSRRGIALKPECIVEGGYTFESGVACAERLLALDERPTAIFACNDEMAAGVYKAAYRQDLQVPGQLSVVGFDDAPIASRIWPALSTVRLPIRDMGRLAATRLLAALGIHGQEQGPQPAPATLITPHLVVRDSAQPPAA